MNDLIKISDNIVLVYYESYESLRKMIKTNDENNKEVARGAGFYTQRPDSNVLCESLMSKLTEKNDDDPKNNVKSAYHSGTDRSDDTSDEEPEKGDESKCSLAQGSSGSRNTPRAFEKSDHLYEKQALENEARKESEDSLEAEDILEEDSVISMMTDDEKIDISYSP